MSEGTGSRVAAGLSVGLACGLLLAMIEPGPANAVEVRLRVAGQTNYDPLGLVGVGVPFEALVTYDTSVWIPVPVISGAYDPITVEFTVGPYTVINTHAGINVEPELPTGHGYAIVNGLGPWTPGDIGGVDIYAIGLNFRDEDFTELDIFDPDLPFALDLSNWELANGGVELVGGGLIGLSVDTFEFVPSDPAELIAGLVGDVIGLNLQNGIANSLDAKLDSALDALEDLNANNDVAAVNSLQAFINSVLAQRGNHIPEAEADTLVASAQAIIDLINES